MKWFWQKERKPKEELSVGSIIHKSNGWVIEVRGSQGSNFRIFMPKMHYYSGHIYDPPEINAPVYRQYLDRIGVWMWGIKQGDKWATFPFIPSAHPGLFYDASTSH